MKSQILDDNSKEVLIFESGAKPSFFTNKMKKILTSENSLIQKTPENNPLVITRLELISKLKNKNDSLTQELLKHSSN